MDKRRSIHYDDLDIKIPIGNMIINILGLSFEHSRPSWYYRNHTHSGYELHFIPDGKGALRVFDKSYEITPGTSYLTGPGVYHEQLADKKEPMSEYCINFEVKVARKLNQKETTYITNEIDNLLNTLKNTNFWFGKDEFSNIELFEKMMEEFDRRLVGYYTCIQSLAMQIIVNAIRSFAKEKKSNYLVPRKIPDDSRRVIVDTYFTDCDKSLYREELAEKIGVTVRQLNRIMHQYYSMSFKEKLIITRLEGAKSLLINSDLSIKEIAEQTGFSSLSYFSRVFNKHFSASPATFRKEKV